MLAYREWRVYLERATLRPILVSTYVSTAWIDPELNADALPEAIDAGSLGTLHGIHGVTDDYPRGQVSSFLKYTPSRKLTQPLAIGAIELSGLIVEHIDGVLRAEHARILALRFPLASSCRQDCDVWIARPSNPQEDGFSSIPGPPPHLPLAALIEGCDHHPYPDELARRRERWRELCGGEERPPYTVAELEQLLLERYEVPRLADGVGPWR